MTPADLAISPVPPFISRQNKNTWIVAFPLKGFEESLAGESEPAYIRPLAVISRSTIPQLAPRLSKWIPWLSV